MLKFDINISFQFPFYRLNEEVEYSEVTKPSGISYILLVLINESNDRSKTLYELLLEFGVPKRLHYIFKDELIKLINNGILTSIASMDEIDSRFDSVRISYLSFTNQGLKIFQDEKILTGNKKTIRAYVYYDIALNEFYLNLSTDLEAKKLNDSPIEVLPYDDLLVRKNVEDFLKINSGKQWNSQNGKCSIKKDEAITSVTEIEKDIFSCKYNGTLKIDDDTVELSFENSLLTKFINQYYNGEIISDMISRKSKFKFSNDVNDGYLLSQCIKNSEVLIPEKLKDILKQKYSLFISKGTYKPNNGSIVTFNDLGGNFDFIAIDKNECINAYELGVFNFTNEQFGKIKIPLIVKSKLSKDLFKDLIKPYVISNDIYDLDKYKQLLKITYYSKDYELLTNITNSYVSDNLIENIYKFNEIASININNNDFKDYILKLLDTNVREYINQVDDTSVINMLKVLKDISNNIKYDDKIVLDLLKDKLNEDKLTNYELFVENGFNRELVLMYYNPIEEALKSDLINDPKLKEFINYYNSIENLKKITGIKDLLRFSYDCEEIDDKLFIKEFNNIYNLKNKINIFKDGNEYLFEQLDSFYSIFDSIHEDVNMISNARKNPKNIKLDYIKKEIIKGNYQLVLVNLSIKLETILSNKYMLEGNLIDKLEEAKSKKILSRSLIDDLHDFRISRNNMVHPEKYELNFTESDLNRWAEEIFDLEGVDNNESKSSN